MFSFLYSFLFSCFMFFTVIYLLTSFLLFFKSMIMMAITITTMIATATLTLDGNGENIDDNDDVDVHDIMF